MPGSNARGRRSWVSYLYPLPFLSVLILNLLFWQGDKKSRRLALIPHHSGFSLHRPVPKGPAPSCAHLEKMVDWTRKHHPQGKRYSFHSNRFAKETAQNYLKKVDPFRVLFTQEQAQHFSTYIASRWKKISKQKNCSTFSDWFNTEYPDKLRAFFQEIRKFQLKKLPVGSSEDSLDWLYGQPEDFAKNTQALSRRRLKLVRSVLATSSKMALQAYKNKRYVLVVESIKERMVDKSALTLLAKAMLNNFDPHSTYLSSEEFEDLYSDLSGSTTGIGVMVRKVPRGLMIEKILAKSPADRSKRLRSGDTIYQINGIAIAPLSEKKAKDLLRGHAGTEVQLAIESQKASSLHRFKVALTRREIQDDEQRVQAQYLSSPKRKKKIALISIPSFYGPGTSTSPSGRSSAEDLKTILQSPQARKNVEAVVLDVRGNPGGYLDEAVDMVGYFVGRKPVVAIHEESKKKLLKGEFKHPLYTGPLLVLVDDQSASAAEVLAAALKDYRRAVIVGSKQTFGKGSIQRLFHATDSVNALWAANAEPIEGMVKLTTSYYYTPSGKTPAYRGVRSDLSLPIPQREHRMALARRIPKVDSFLPKESSRARQEQRKRHTSDIQALKSQSESRRAQDARWSKLQSMQEDKADSLVTKEVIRIAADYVQRLKRKSIQ